MGAAGEAVGAEEAMVEGVEDFPEAAVAPEAAERVAVGSGRLKVNA